MKTHKAEMIVLSLISRQNYRVAYIQITLVLASMLFSACTQSPDIPQNIPSSQQPAPDLELDATKQQFLNSVSLMQAGQYNAAQQLLSKLVKQAPKRSVYWANYAVSQYKSGDAQAALLSIDSALALQPTLEAALNLKAVILIDLGRVSDAEKLLLSAVAKYPDNSNLLYNIALVYDIYFQDARKAAHYYQRYLNLAKEDAETASWLKQLKAR
jgi:tetratricopeptide (TPR) repeat protein